MQLFQFSFGVKNLSESSAMADLQVSKRRLIYPPTSMWQKYRVISRVNIFVFFLFGFFKEKTFFIKLDHKGKVRLNRYLNLSGVYE